MKMKMKMKMKIQIDGIKLTVGKKKLEITIDEAKELHRALNDLFKVEVVHHYNNHWWYHPQPIIQPYEITYDTTTGSDFITISAT